MSEEAKVRHADEAIARNSIQHGCQACAGGTHVDLNMAAEHRESVESNVNFASFC